MTFARLQKKREPTLQLAPHRALRTPPEPGRRSQPFERIVLRRHAHRRVGGDEPDENGNQRDFILRVAVKCLDSPGVVEPPGRHTRLPPPLAHRPLNPHPPPFHPPLPPPPPPPPP